MLNTVLSLSPQMAVQQRMLVRVIFIEADIRKVELTTRPDTVDLLIGSLKEVLQIHYDFCLQFKDPNFDNELCNLTEMSELPERPTLKIIPRDTPSKADTDILSTSSEERQRQWPEVFDMNIYRNSRSMWNIDCVKQTCSISGMEHT